MLLAAPDKVSTGFKGGVVAALFFRHPSNQRPPHNSRRIDGMSNFTIPTPVNVRNLI